MQRDSREAYEVNFELGSSLVSAQGSLLHKKYLSDIERSYTHSAELTYTWFRGRATTLSFTNEVRVLYLYFYRSFVSYIVISYSYSYWSPYE